jgi:hypothetical protein
VASRATPAGSIANEAPEVAFDARCMSVQSRPRLAALSILLGACSRAPAEPEGGAAPSATPRAELRWEVPPTWALERDAARGPYRAKYKIPPQGGDKLEAELLVSWLGRGSKADVGQKLDEFLGDFEGPGVAEARRDTFRTGDIEIHTLEVAATYKAPMGPVVGPKKKSPAQVIREGWRGLGAGVRAGESGHWFFRMVGPDGTMQATRPAFRAMLDGLKVEPPAER